VLHVTDGLIRFRTIKTNVTLKLDADLLRDARVLAVEEGRSISALLTDRPEVMVRERKVFDKARRRALARLGGESFRRGARPITPQFLDDRLRAARRQGNA
jgi:hypothetical protein